MQKDVTQLLTLWSYISFALSHRFHVVPPLFDITQIEAWGDKGQLSTGVEVSHNSL